MLLTTLYCSVELPPCSLISAHVCIFSSIYIPPFSVPHPLLLYSYFHALSLPQPSCLPPSIPPFHCPSSRFVLQLCQHSLSHSISFSGSMISCLPSTFTWPGVVRWDGQLTRFPAQSSLQIESSNTNLSTFYAFFLLVSSCSGFLLPPGPPVFLFFFSWSPLLLFYPNQQKRESERGKASPMTLFFFLSSLFTPPPLLFSASFTSPSLIQLPGRRDCLQRLLHSAWATILSRTTSPTVGVEVSDCVFRCL